MTAASPGHGDAHGRLQWGDVDIVVTPDGTARLGSSGPAVLVRPPAVEAGVAGVGPVPWDEAALSVVDGEAESVRVAHRLRWTVRHHVGDAVWTLRATLASGDPGPALGAAHVDVDPGRGTAWVWAAGSEALVVLADDPERPVALRLRRGRLTVPDPRSARVSDRVFEWLPGGSDLTRPAVLELSGCRCRSWTEVAALLPAWLPPLALPAGDDLLLHRPDDAVSAPEAAVGPTGEVSVRGQGRVVIRVEGVSGDLELEAHFAPPLRDLQRRAADRVEARVVQGWSAGQAADVVAAQLIVLAATGRTDTEAFDLLAGSVVEHVHESPLRPLALAHVAVVTGERTALDALREAVGGLRGPTARVIVTEMLLVGLGDPAVTDVISAGAPDLSQPHEAAVALAARLGAGLPGRRAPEDPLAAAEDAACLALASGRLDPLRWPYPAAVVVEHTARRLRATWQGDERVLAWLGIAEAHG